MCKKLKAATEVSRYFFEKGLDPKGLQSDDYREITYDHKKEYWYKDVLILTEIDDVLILEYEK